MNAIMVTCPNCGARLKVVGDSETVTCEYCDTAARVARRTRFSRVMTPPTIGPTPIAVQRHATRALVWFVGLFFIAPIVIIGLVIYLVTSKVEHAAKSAFATATSSNTRSSSRPGVDRDQIPEWQGTDSALFVDVDRDGTLDVVGRSRRVRAGDSVRVIALAGATGKVLWESEPLGTYSDTYQGKLAVLGDLVLYVSPRAELRALALATGAMKWKVRLEERADAFCAATDATVMVLGTDGAARIVKRADGTLAETVPPGAPVHGRPTRAPCQRLVTDDVEHRHDTELYDLGRKLGVSSDEMYAGPGGRVLSATRAKGTHVPTLVALDDHDQARWTILVPTDPLGSIERAPEVVAVGEHEVCASYYTDSVARPQHVACFALADGKRIWDIEAGGTSLRALAIVGGALFVSSVGKLDVFDVATGKPRWTFGE